MSILKLGTVLRLNSRFISCRCHTFGTRSKSSSLLVLFLLLFKIQFLCKHVASGICVELVFIFLLPPRWHVWIRTGSRVSQSSCLKSRLTWLVLRLTFGRKHLLDCPFLSPQSDFHICFFSFVFSDSFPVLCFLCLLMKLLFVLHSLCSHSYPEESYLVYYKSVVVSVDTDSSQ